MGKYRRRRDRRHFVAPPAPVTEDPRRLQLVDADFNVELPLRPKLALRSWRPFRH